MLNEQPLLLTQCRWSVSDSFVIRGNSIRVRLTRHQDKGITTTGIFGGQARFLRSIMTARTATISRKTNETQIEVFLSLDCSPGSGQAQNIDISTGIGFLDHVALPPYSGRVDN